MISIEKTIQMLLNENYCVRKSMFYKLYGEMNAYIYDKDCWGRDIYLWARTPEFQGICLKALIDNLNRDTSVEYPERLPIDCLAVDRLVEHMLNKRETRYRLDATLNKRG